MSDEERRKAIIAAVARWGEAVDEVLSLAEDGPCFTPDECPLQGKVPEVGTEHRHYSQGLFGAG